jgi:hypothetical protein
MTANPRILLLAATFAAAFALAPAAPAFAQAPDGATEEAGEVAQAEAGAPRAARPRRARNAGPGSEVQRLGRIFQRVMEKRGVAGELTSFTIRTGSAAGERARWTCVEASGALTCRKVEARAPRARQPQAR